MSSGAALAASRRLATNLLMSTPLASYRLRRSGCALWMLVARWRSCVDAGFFALLARDRRRSAGERVVPAAGLRESDHLAD